MEEARALKEVGPGTSDRESRVHAEKLLKGMPESDTKSILAYLFYRDGTRAPQYHPPGGKAAVNESTQEYLTYDQARAKIEQVRDPVVQEILHTLLRPSSSMPL